MTTVVFKLQANTPEQEIGTALKQICSITELFNVKAVFPNETDKSLKGVYTAEVSKGASAVEAMKAIKAAPYVESVYVAPKRELF